MNKENGGIPIEAMLRFCSWSSDLLDVHVTALAQLCPDIPIIVCNAETVSSNVDLAMTNVGNAFEGHRSFLQESFCGDLWNGTLSLLYHVANKKGNPGIEVLPKRFIKAFQSDDQLLNYRYKPSTWENYAGICVENDLGYGVAHAQAMWESRAGINQTLEEKQKKALLFLSQIDLTARCVWQPESVPEVLERALYHKYEYLNVCRDELITKGRLRTS